MTDWDCVGDGVLAPESVGDEADVLSALPQDHPANRAHRPDQPVAGQATACNKTTTILNERLKNKEITGRAIDTIHIVLNQGCNIAPRVLVLGCLVIMQC